jgi:MerR family redox-sensitive transcriptional activator SoxR
MFYNAVMRQLTISNVARQAGLRPSAIRYYEQIGILPLAQRISGQRRYDQTMLYRLAVIQRSRQLGFTLDEIKKLFFGFRKGTPASKRWKELSRRKLAELAQLMEGIKAIQSLLQPQGKCGCASLEECGRCIFQKGGVERS